MKTRFSIGPFALVLVALAACVATSAEAGKKARKESSAPQAPSGVSGASSGSTADRVVAAPAGKELGDAYEWSRLLGAADRLASLESIEAGLDPMLRHAVDDESRAAAQLLLARVAWDRGHYEKAGEAAREALSRSGRGPFEDDAAFVEIEALEAAGRDAEAAREWTKWEKRWPESPLVPAARLAAAWNALRRGEVADARKALATLAKSHPWIERESRFALARAIACAAESQWSEALAALGETPRDVSSAFLRALCLDRSGQLLRAAAAYQDVAERWGDTPLRDPARLAKANAFLSARDYRSAAEEFSRVVRVATDEHVRAEAELRAAGCVFLAGRVDSSLALLRGIAERHDGTDFAARAQFLIGEALVAQGRHEPAILEYNRVLTRYFEHKVAASAQYRVARCLDQLGRKADATGSYQAVVTGYSLAPEAPAAAYLAGLGLLSQGKSRAAVPYFQLVLDRYARRNTEGRVVFAEPAHQELTEAALCLLEYSLHVAGDLGQLSGAPHLLLSQMPPSRSPWRAYALLIDADAMAAQGRFADAERTLEGLARDFADSPVGAPATKLLAWTYARQGRDSLAIASEERLLARYGASGRDDIVSSAFLDIAHARFNQKRYRDAAGAYEDFLRRWPTHPRRLLALYQAGLCYSRLDRAGDAVDRWEALVRDSADADMAERAWARAGDTYFQAQRYDDARRSYRGLLEHFSASHAAGLASLRLAQCEYNAGRDAQALEAFATVIERFANTPYEREAKRGTELALYRLSQRPDGHAVLARLVEQFPTSAFAADALLQIAKRRLQEKKWAEAADGFRQVVSRFPGYSAADQAQFLMADASAQAGDSEGARNAYEQFLSWFPNSEFAPTAGLRLGLLHFEAKNFAAAAVAFTRVLSDSAPSDVRAAARFDLALCHRQLGESEEARAEFGRYRAEFPSGSQTAEVIYQLADMDEAAENLPAAVQGFERALELGPRAALAAEIGYRLGRCLERQKDAKGAMRAYTRAAQSGDRTQPFRLSAVARLAALHESRREVTLAVEAYRDIVRNSKDKELVAAAEDRLSQLSAAQRRR